MRHPANISRALAVEEGMEVQELARLITLAAQRLCRHLEGLDQPGEIIRLLERRKQKTVAARNNDGPRSAA